MQAVKAYCEEGLFIPFQPVKIPNGRHAIITILDFPLNEDKSTSDTDSDTNNTPSESRMAWLDRLEAAIDLAVDEELPDWAFQRSQEMRPPLDLRD